MVLMWAIKFMVHQNYHLAFIMGRKLCNQRSVQNYLIEEWYLHVTVIFLLLEFVLQQVTFVLNKIFFDVVVVLSLPICTTWLAGCTMCPWRGWYDCPLPYAVGRPYSGSCGTDPQLSSPKVNKYLMSVIEMYGRWGAWRIGIWEITIYEDLYIIGDTFLWR